MMLCGSAATIIWTGSLSAAADCPADCRPVPVVPAAPPHAAALVYLYGAGPTLGVLARLVLRTMGRARAAKALAVCVLHQQEKPASWG